MSADIARLPDKSQRLRLTPLNKDAPQIRIVQIKPSPDRRGPIHCVVEHLDIPKSIDTDSHVQDEGLQPTDPNDNITAIAKSDENGSPSVALNLIALSYASGPEAPVQDIFIESHDSHGWLSIQQDLHDFLKVRREATSKSPWFWDDQICIDQQDKEEKSQQVFLMPTIYSRARRVEVWLGPAFEQSDEAMDLILKLAESNMNQKEIDLAQAPLQSTLATTMKMPYWSRLWTVQELLLARNITIRLGKKTMPWEKFWTGCLKSLTNKYVTPSAWINIYTLARSTRPYLLKGNWPWIQTIVPRRDCSDVRDKVFGVLGLLPEELRFYPDYTFESEDVLFEILSSISRSYTSLHSSAIPNIRKLDFQARFWIVALGLTQENFDLKTVRHFLLHEAYPAFRTDHALTFQSDMRRCWSPVLGKRPMSMERVRLWWLYPSKDSVRWHSRHWCPGWTYRRRRWERGDVFFTHPGKGGH